MQELRVRKNIETGQSIIEYVVLFAIIVVTSVVFMQMVPAIFGDYVSNAKGLMQ